MEQDQTYYLELITAYLYNEATAEQVEGLSEWISADESNRKLFEDYHRVWYASTRETFDSLDVKKEFGLFLQEIDKPRIINIQENRAGSGKWKFYLGYAAVFAIIAIASAALFWFIGLTDKGTEFVSLDTNSHIELPDGSQVDLKKGARLVYYQKSKLRWVELTGDAYFEVQHHDKIPFLVESGPVRIKVLGTKFYVHAADPGSSVKVMLDEGAVSVYFDKKPKESLILAPGESALMDNKKQQMQKSVIADKNDMAWKTGQLIFNSTALPQVINQLNQYYDSKISIGSAGLEKCMLSATFDNMPLPDVLLVVCQTLNLEIINQQGRIILSGSPCN